jgi:prevent-host-death family protein
MEVGVYEAKTHLPRLLARVARGETITITRHGKPVAVLRPVRETQAREAEEEVTARLAQRRRNRPAGRGTPTAAEIVAARDAGRR